MPESEKIQQMIRDAVIVPEFAATTKRELIEEVVDAAVGCKAMMKKNREPVLKRLVAREELGSTGIGNGVAVPHVKGDDIKSPFLVVGRSVSGVDFNAIDGRPVHTVFLLGSPEDRAEDHLRCLRWVSGLARNADFRRFFLAAEDETAIRDLLHEMSP